MTQGLPFPIHGTRFGGGSDGRASLAGQAARVLYQANLLADTAGVPVLAMRQRVPGGWVLASRAGPLAFKYAVRHEDTPEEGEAPAREAVATARLMWVPEGFVVTPRTLEAPDGYGMPPTLDGRGTPGGILTQVMINRYEHNNYPDVVLRYSPEFRKLMARYGRVRVARLTCALAFPAQWELVKGEAGIGVTCVPPQGRRKFDPQFQSFEQLWSPRYGEPESDRWFCHRPQTTPHMDAPEQEVLRGTNELREEEGDYPLPLGAPLRPYAGDLPYALAYQMRYTGELEHDSPSYRPGHQTFLQRVDRAANAFAFGENLLRVAPARVSVGAARTAVEGWADSPPHRANMLDDWHYTDGGAPRAYAVLDSILTPDGPKFNPQNGVLGVQIFKAYDSWVYAGQGVRDAAPAVTLIDAGGDDEHFVRAYPQKGSSTSPSYYPQVCFLGRASPVFDDVMDPTLTKVVSAAYYFRPAAGAPEARHTFRVAVIRCPSRWSGPAYLQILEGDVGSFAETAVEIGRFNLPYELSMIVGRPRWSASGERMIFSYTTLTEATGDFVKAGTESWTLPIPYLFGQVQHFVEFVGEGAGWIPLSSESVDVVPTINTSGAQWSIHLACAGSYRFLADYEGETAVFAVVHYEGQIDYAEGSRFKIRVTGELSFPNDARVPYVDIEAGDDRVGVFAVYHGFVRHFLGLDIRRPDLMAYIQYTFPETDAEFMRADIVACGQVIKSGYDPMGYGAPGRIGVRQDPRRANGLPTLSVIHGTSISPDLFGSINRLPRNPWPALIVPNLAAEPPAWRLPHGTDPDSGGALKLNGVFIGPTVLWGRAADLEIGGYADPSHAAYCRYGDEVIHAGRITNTLGQRTAPLWAGDDQFYSHSTLDLPEITGLQDLRPNIGPIGVI